MFYQDGIRQVGAQDFTLLSARNSTNYCPSLRRHIGRGVAAGDRLRRVCQQLQLTTKLTLAAMFSTLLCAAMILAVTLMSLQDAAGRQEQEKLASNLRVAWHLLRQHGPSIRLVGAKLRAGATVLDGDTTVVDGVQDLVGGVATIFRGVTRVSTNVRLTDGTRATGTELAPGPVYDAVIRRHQRYDGIADILGKPYVTAYDPIVSPEGELIGILFVGERSGQASRPRRGSRATA